MQTSKVHGILGWKSYSERFHIVHVIRETTSFDCKCSKQLNFSYQRHSVIWVTSFTFSFMFLRMRGEAGEHIIQGKKRSCFLFQGLNLHYSEDCHLESFFSHPLSLSFSIETLSSYREHNPKNANLRMMKNCHVVCKRILIFMFGFKTYLERTVICRTLNSTLRIFVVIIAE